MKTTTLRCIIVLFAVVGLSACIPPRSAVHDVTPPSNPSDAGISETPQPVPQVQAPRQTIDTSFGTSHSVIKVEATPSVLESGKLDYAFTIVDPASGETVIGYLAPDVSELARIPLDQLAHASEPVQACIYVSGTSHVDATIERVEPGLCGLSLEESEEIVRLLSSPVAVVEGSIVAMQSARERLAIPDGAQIVQITFAQADIMSVRNSAVWEFTARDGATYTFVGLRAQPLHMDILTALEGVPLLSPACIEIAAGEGVQPTVIDLLPFACQ